MVNKELKRLGRKELVDIIYQMKKNEEELLEKVAHLEAALENQRLELTSAGSIADAAVGVTRLFSTAQATADLYLQEIKNLKRDTAEACEHILDEARQQAEAILAEAAAAHDSKRG